MALKVINISINRNAIPPSAQVIMVDDHNCNVSVPILLEGKNVEQFTLQELSDLAHKAAKHLVSQA